MEQIYTTNQIIEILKISKNTFYNYVRLGKLRAKKVGKNYLVTESALQEFLAS